MLLQYSYKVYKVEYSVLETLLSFFFFKKNQQFITWCMKVDHGSYFRNYVQKKHTNRKIGREKRERTKTETKRRTN